MNKRQKEVFQLQLQAEEDILKELEKLYQAALKDIKEKVQLFESDISLIEEAIRLTEMDDVAKAAALSNRQSKVYQKQYQEALEKQLEGILDKLHSDEYGTLQKYLQDSYEDAFIGTLYDLHGQGIPMIMPIDQAAAVKAIMTDSKISGGLYASLGVDVKGLKKAIRQEITRGIASGMGIHDIARNISNVSKAPMGRAKNIARTECHRIQQASTFDAQEKAKGRGADVVKQWDSTLDGATRPVHMRLDGQIREVDEPFEAGGRKAMYPGDFGDPAEDCNCRCVSLTRARWALDDDELQTLKDRAEFFGLDKTENFNDFKERFLGSLDAISSPINARNTARGKPQGIMQVGAELNTRQKKLLEKLGQYDSSVVVDKNEVSMIDLCALTASTGDEFALFTKGNQRMVVRGNSTSVNIDIDKAKEMAHNGYKWSGHTHPGVDDLSLVASQGDYAVLKAFGQKEGIIYNSLGHHLIFSLGDSE